MLAERKEHRTAPAATSGLSPWLKLAFRIGGRLKRGTLTIVLPDRARATFQGDAPGPEGTVVLHRERAVRRFATGGSLGFAEAYLDGDWDSPDLPRTLELFAVNLAAIEDRYYGGTWSRWLAWLRHAMRPNTKAGSRRNVHAHYDLGNDFYARWLDPSMTYSAARFAGADGSLEEAQRRKLADMAERIELHPDHHVLEIGCGWGSFAEFAAAEVGARVTAITISEQQYDFVARRIRDAGLNERVDVRLEDYRDVHGAFDRVASIEMLEAVGERYWPVFFERVRDRLVPGGIAGIQVITIADRFFDAYRRGADFIQRYVFPGGMLPAPGALADEIARAGLIPRSEVTFGLDYARTLGAWNANFQRAWPEIRGLGFDARFKRLWDYYLAYCEAGFRAGFIDVAQIAFQRP